MVLHGPDDPGCRFVVCFFIESAGAESAAFSCFCACVVYELLQLCISFRIFCCNTQRRCLGATGKFQRISTCTKRGSPVQSCEKMLICFNCECCSTGLVDVVEAGAISDAECWHRLQLCEDLRVAGEDVV